MVLITEDITIRDIAWIRAATVAVDNPMAGRAPRLAASRACKDHTDAVGLVGKQRK